MKVLESECKNATIKWINCLMIQRKLPTKWIREGIWYCLPACFFFLRHILVETCIYCSHTRSKLLTITAQLMVRKKVQTCSSSNPSIINMKYFFGWCNKLEASIQIWTAKKSLSVLQNNGKPLINWFYPVTNHAQTSPISLPVCSHLIHLQHKCNSFTSIQL